MIQGISFQPEVPPNLIPDIPPAELIGPDAVAKLAIAKAELFAASPLPDRQQEPKATAVRNGHGVVRVH